MPKVNMVRGTLALTALVTVMSAPAHAAVVVYDGPPIPIGQDISGLYLNVVTGSTAEGGFGWDINIYFNDVRIAFWSPGVTQGYVGAFGSIESLAPGSVVGPSSSFLGSNVIGGFDAPAFESAGTGFFGFRFINEGGGGSLHYGWAQISTGDDVGFPASLLTYAFESSPNTPITVVPEPGTYALMLTGVLGIMGMAARRRKAG